MQVEYSQTSLNFEKNGINADLFKQPALATA